MDAQLHYTVQYLWTISHHFCKRAFETHKQEKWALVSPANRTMWNWWTATYKIASHTHRLNTWRSFYNLVQALFHHSAIRACQHNTLINTPRRQLCVWVIKMNIFVQIHNITEFIPACYINLSSLNYFFHDLWNHHKVDLNIQYSDIKINVIMTL